MIILTPEQSDALTALNKGFFEQHGLIKSGTTIEVVVLTDIKVATSPSFGVTIAPHGDELYARTPLHVLTGMSMRGKSALENFASIGWLLRSLHEGNCKTLRIRNCGTKTVQEIAQKLEDLGMHPQEGLGPAGPKEKLVLLGLTVPFIGRMEYNIWVQISSKVPTIGDLLAIINTPSRFEEFKGEMVWATERHGTALASLRKHISQMGLNPDSATG
jgi:hypothetical protein